jgi:hypothetical protein
MDKAHGLTWYTTANLHAQNIAAAGKIPVYKAAGVIAALSPQNKWGRNVTDALNLVTGQGDKFATYSANVEKARIILTCSDPDQVYKVLGGRKVQAFYDNILHVKKSQLVTIDGHAVNIANRTKFAMTKVETLTPAKYTAFCDLYRRAAKIAGIHPIEMQAITWCAWRNGADKRQLSLF